jgi:hypothetical protein
MTILQTVFLELAPFIFGSHRRFGGTSVQTKNTRRKIPEDGFLHSHRREDLKSYRENIVFLFYKET